MASARDASLQLGPYELQSCAGCVFPGVKKQTNKVWFDFYLEATSISAGIISTHSNVNTMMLE